MSDIAARIEELGGLHDCTIVRMVVLPHNRVVEFDIKDINRNLESLPEYPGPKPGTLIFSGVSSISQTGAPDAWIYEVTIQLRETGFDTAIVLNSWNCIEIESASVDLVTT